MTVVVTGTGAVTSLGVTAVETFARLAEGARGLRPLTLFDAAGYRTALVAEVALAEAPGERPTGDVSRTSALALRAAEEALRGSALPRGDRALRLGLVVGGTTAGMLETESLLSVLVSPEGEVDEAAQAFPLGD